MLYHILKLNSIPEPVFAHVYSCPQYKCHFKETVPNLEIIYVISGNLKVQILDQTMTVKEKCFLILPHRYKLYIETQDDEVYMHYTVSAMVDANSRLVENIPERLEPDEICIPFYLEPCDQTEKMVSLLKKAVQEYQYADKISKQKCGILFAELLCDIAKNTLKEYTVKSSKNQDILDKRIKLYIEKNMNQKITLADIAEAIGKNANYLNQIFKKKNNMPIIAYINLVKMKKVASCISSENMTLREAAKEVGITDTSYLSRLFKKKMGMSISEFKNNSADFTFHLNDSEKIG